MNRARLHLLFFSAITTSFVAVGCGSADDPASGAATSEAAIVNGEETNDFPAIGQIFFGNDQIGWSSCTATLIRPQVILTAAHCVTGKPDSGIRANFGGKQYGVDVWSWSGTWVEDRSVSLSRKHDWAIARLTEPVPGIEWMRMTVDIPADRTWFTAVGFGQERSGGASGTKRRAWAWVTDSGGAWVRGRGGDGPGGKSSVCFGDSGGPAIDDQGRVFGVLAKMESSNCDGWFAYTRVSIEWNEIHRIISEWGADWTW